MSGIRFVPTFVHAYFDYIGGIALIAAPFVFWLCLCWRYRRDSANGPGCWLNPL